MRGRSLSILGILAAVAGAILILCYNNIKVSGVLITFAIVFVGVGLVNLLFYSSITRTDNTAARVLSLVTNAASIVLGVSMLVYQGTFIPMVTFMFGLLVGVCSLWQFFVLAVGARPYQLPVWLYLFPIALAGACAYIFIRRPANGEDHILMLTMGIALGLLGIACVIEGSILGVARRADHVKRKAEAAKTLSEATDDDDEDERPAQQKKEVETTDDLDDPVMEPGDEHQ